MTTASKLLELARHHEDNCNRYMNGGCRTLGCMRRGGYVTGPFDYENPPSTCQEHETAVALREQAAIISRLTAENAAMRKALEPFALLADLLPSQYRKALDIELAIAGSSAFDGVTITVGELLATRAALATPTETDADQ